MCFIKSFVCLLHCTALHIDFFFFSNCDISHTTTSFIPFFQAFTIYEESVSGSKAQSSAIALIIGTLRSMTVFGYENYETLSTKCAVHCSRQLKRVDQCRGMLLVAHLFWCTDTDGKKSGSVVSSTAAAAATAVGNASSPSKREESKPAFKDAKRVLECMQKALKIADSVMDRNVSVELFVEVLESCVWFYEKKNDSVNDEKRRCVDSSFFPPPPSQLPPLYLDHYEISELAY